MEWFLLHFLLRNFSKNRKTFLHDPLRCQDWRDGKLPPPPPNPSGFSFFDHFKLFVKFFDKAFLHFLSVTHIDISCIFSKDYFLLHSIDMFFDCYYLKPWNWWWFYHCYCYKLWYWRSMELLFDCYGFKIETLVLFLWLLL